MAGNLRTAVERTGLHRVGLVKIARNVRPAVGPSARILPLLIAAFLAMGLAEATLLMLIVQMAVALASERTTFDIVLGPISVTGISIRASVAIGTGLVAVLFALLVPTAMASGSLAARAQLRTRTRLIHAYLRASWSERSSYEEGHLQEVITVHAARSEQAVTQFINATTAFCNLLAILTVAIVASPLVAAAATLCVTGAGALLKPVMSRTRSAATAQVEAGRQFASQMAEVSRITPEVTVFDVAPQVEEIVVAQAQEVAVPLRRLRALSRLVSSAYQYAALLLIVFSVGVLTFTTDAAGLATMGTVLLLLVRALTYGQNLQTQIQVSNETAPFLERTEEEIRRLTSCEVNRAGRRIDSPAPLRLDDVWFAYEDGRDVLRGVHLQVGLGESIAIVGPSGAGKSTLIQLLLRLRQPTSGSILVDGVPLDEVSLDRWYELIATVPQDNQLIRATVADNIRFYRDDLADDAVVAAARRAHVHDEIMDLPDGYDTMLGQGVRQLSGGQRQRLGIARALVGDPLLIVFDEPTSALDSRSEQLVANTLDDLHGEVTMIVIAHRPATTAHCDRVVRLTNGTARTIAITEYLAGSEKPSS